MARLGWGSGIASGGVGPIGGSLIFHRLFLGSVLDRAKDVGHFALEDGEVEVDDAASRVEDYVDWGMEGGKIFANRFAHTALDAIAIYSFAHNLADGETDAGARGVRIAERRAVGTEERAWSEKVGHLSGELFAAGLVHALIVGVFAETEDDGSGSHTAELDLMWVESRMTQF
jgi:hypothetical protein